MEAGFNGMQVSLQKICVVSQEWSATNKTVLQRILSNFSCLRYTRRLFTFSLCLSLIEISNFAVAGPWIEPGDEQLRHHIQVLADAGIITVPITTWPLMWAGIKRDIDAASRNRLSPDLLGSLNYVSFEFNEQANREQQLSYRISVSNDPNIFRDFASDQREKYELETEYELLGDWWAIKLDLNVVNDPLIESDDSRFRADGSYASAVWGNWSWTIGAIDHWWGPGWETSLILSTSARPVPGITIQRNFSDAPESKWLQWIGPWHLSAFAGKLDGGNAVTVPDAKLLGMRVGFKPLQSLEINLSRTAQWGGDGRPQDLSSFWKMFIGKDNLDGYYDENVGGGEVRIITEEDIANEPSNQLAGIDFRYNFNIAKSSNGFYGQLIGEDESNYAPSLNTLLLGLENSFKSQSASHRFVFEVFDTSIDSYGDPIYNVAYRHGIYQSGYVNKGRIIGAWTDNDSRLISLSGYHFFESQSIGWRLGRLELNRDGNGTAHLLSPEIATELKTIRLDYSRYWDRIKLSTSVTYNSEELTVGLNEIGKTLGQFGFEYRL